MSFGSQGIAEELDTAEDVTDADEEERDALEVMLAMDELELGAADELDEIALDETTADELEGTAEDEATELLETISLEELITMDELGTEELLDGI